MAAAAFVWATGSLANASVSTNGYYFNAGDTVQITGDQMSPGENVTVDVDLPDGSLSQEHVVVADGNGDFADSYTLAADAPAGIYTVVATGQSSGNVFTTTFDPGSAATCMNGVTPTGGSVTQTSITVDWSTANCNGNTDGFRVKYGTTQGGPYGSTVTVNDSSATSQVLSDLDCNTTYYFVVEAFFSTGSSGGEQNSTSAEGDATTSACSTGATVDAGGPYSGSEGDVIALDGASVTDGGANPHYSWSVDTAGSVAGDTAADSGAACAFTPSATVLSPSVSCTDDSNGGYFTLTLSYYDDSNGSAGSPLTDTATLTLENVAPVVDPASNWTVTPSNCSVSISAGFTDAGLNDTHTATIDWGDGTTSSSPSDVTVTEETSTTNGTVSGSHTYSGPNTYTIKVTVTDDEGASGDASKTDFSNNPSVVYPLPPIMSAKTFNTGSTIPVKVSVTGCTTGLQPTISVTPQVTTVKSSGKSNLQDFLRYTTALPGFIYNWNTKGWTAQAYLVAINGLPGGQITAPVTLTK